MKSFKEYNSEEEDVKEEDKEEDTMPSEYEPTSQNFYADYIKKTTHK